MIDSTAINVELFGLVAVFQKRLFHLLLSLLSLFVANSYPFLFLLLKMTCRVIARNDRTNPNKFNP